MPDQTMFGVTSKSLLGSSVFWIQRSAIASATHQPSCMGQITLADEQVQVGLGGLAGGRARPGGSGDESKACKSEAGNGGGRISKKQRIPCCESGLDETKPDRARQDKTGQDRAERVKE